MNLNKTAYCKSCKKDRAAEYPLLVTNETPLRGDVLRVCKSCNAQTKVIQNAEILCEENFNEKYGL